MKRIAVDIGGTFTDLIYVDDETAEMKFDKVKSSPQQPEKAVLESIKRTGIDVPSVSIFIHGTTTALNTLLQRKGSKTGVITTKGFRDVLEFARMNRPDEEYYNVFWKRPPPFAPRDLRVEADERTKFTGEILRTLDEETLSEGLEKLRSHGVESIAVCLLHSYANPRNEIIIKEIIGRKWPDVSVSLSHEVASEWREFERTSTTVIDAYIKKPVKKYLDALSAGLKSIGFRGEVLIMHCAGGTLTAGMAAETPVPMLISGPVGGVIGALSLGEQLGIGNILTADPGGTSFDISVIADGKSIVSPEMKMLERYTTYPALMPSIDIRSIGAGGGSIAYIESGLLHVGPESAGAEPGPMCYGRGGSRPTVTDAAVVNGIIDPDNFLGGEIPLYADFAIKGVNEIAKLLGIGMHETADGILTVAKDNMANTVREMLVGEGYDPTDFTIFSYGGAGGIFASHIAREIGVKHVVIPIAPAHFSAWGMLNADVVHTFSQTYVSTLDDLEIDKVRDIYTRFQNSASNILRKENISQDRWVFTKSVDMRYEGQGHSVECILPTNLEQDNIKDQMKKGFSQLHYIKYGHTMDSAIQTINYRLRAVGRLNRPPIREIPSGTTTPPSDAKREVRKIFMDANFLECNVYERKKLLAGNIVKGPAIIEEPSHTTAILGDQIVTVDKFGDLIIEIRG